MTDLELNKIETWIAEHSIRIFLVIAALICVGAFFAVQAFVQSGQAAREVDVLKPQVTKIVRAAATCSAQTIKEKETSNACAARLRFALIVCRRSAQCRAALLAIVNYPPPAKPVTSTSPSSTAAPNPKGGAIQQPSHAGHQQPGPSGGQPQEGSQEASPAPSEPEGGSGAAPGQESPGNGAQGSQGGSSPSGADVEVCVLEHTCVGAEVGLGGL
jgi:hypothetical protein